MDHSFPPRVALIRTGLLFAVVTLVWLVLASFLPNFHVADATPTARAVFIGIALMLLATILLAQLAMLRTWFRSLEEERPERARSIARGRLAVLLLIAVGVGSGLSVLWYATATWMPQVHDALQGK